MKTRVATPQGPLSRFRQLLRAGHVAARDDPKQILLAFLPLLICVPWRPSLSTSNYEYLLHLTRASGLQFGKDVLSTYGPLGFLGLPFFHPATFALLLTFNVTVYVVLIVRLIVVARALGVGRVGSWSCLVLLPGAVGNPPEWAPILFTPYLLVLLYCLESIATRWRLGWRAAAVYAVLLAAFTLMKLTFVPLALAAVVLCGIAEAWHGSLPRTALIYAATLPLLWLVSGQSVAHVAGFMAGASEIVAGYKDGAGVWDLSVLPSAFPLVLAQAMLWLAATAAAWRFGRSAALVVAVILFLDLYAVLMNGYTRGDIQHAIPCIMTTLSLWALLGALLSARVPEARPRLVTPFRWAALPILAAAALAWVLNGLVPDYRPIVRQPIGLCRLVLRGTAPLKADAIAIDEQLRRESVPGLVGSKTDAPNGNPGIATASGATLRLRPTLASYVAYTPMLARTNSDFLESTRGPESVLLQHPFAIDEKFPTIEDTSSWLALLTHYQFVRQAGRSALLERRPSPRVAHRSPLGSRTIAPGEDLVVPGDESRLIWAEIVVSPNLVGRLMASAFKPIPVFLTTSLADGTVKTDRIVLRMARSGFLLSPYLGGLDDLRSLLADGDGDGRRPHAVKTLKVGSESPRAFLQMKKFYDRDVHINFYELRLDSDTRPRTKRPDG